MAERKRRGESEGGRGKSEKGKPLGRWLVENMPRGVNLEIPADRKSSREIPFASDESAAE